MNPTKTGLYATYADDRSVLLYWDGDDWVDQNGIRPCYKKVQWTGKPLFVPALRTWVGLTDEDWAAIEDMPDTFDQGVAWAAARLKERNT
jgi:hypothetical protein